MSSEITIFAADVVGGAAHQAAFALRKKVQADFREVHRRALDEIQNVAAARIRGEILPVEMRAGIQEQLDSAAIHTYLAGKRLASGNPQDLITVEDRKIIRSYLESQSKYLEQFQRDVRAYNGKYSESDQWRVMWRAGMYADSLQGLANKGFMVQAARSNPDLRGIWELGPHEHCGTCIKEAAIGERPLNKFTRYPGDGSTECKTNCGCSIRIITPKRRIDIASIFPVAPQTPTQAKELVARL